jgi:PAS domain S-box-containing protein
VKSEALARSEVTRESFNSEIFRALIENLWDAVVVFDFSGKCIFVNKAAEKLTGYKKEEMLGNRAREVILGKYRALCDRMNKLAKSGRPVPYFEVEMRRKDGTVVCVETGGQVIKKNGKPIGTLIVARDISDEKKAQEALKESEQKFQRLFMNNPEAAVFWDKDFRILDINPRFTELFGYILDEVGGKDNAEMIVPEDRVEEARILAEKSRKGHVYDDAVRMRKDGSLVDVAISVAPMIIGGRLLGYVGLYKDITDRKRAEEALRESEERYRLLFEQCPIGIGIATSDGIVIDSNRVMQAITGYSKEELRKINLADTYEILEQRKALLEAVKQHGLTVDFSVRLKRKDGTLYNALLNVSRVRIKGKDFLQTTCQDITERKKAEYALQVSEKRYRTLFESTREGIITPDPDGRILSANLAAAAILGYETPEELVGMYTGELYADQGQRRILLKELMENGCVEDFEAVVRRKDGTYAHVLADITIERDKEGNILRTHGIFRDISERKRIEQSLRESEQKYKNLFENARDLIVTTDLEGNITSVNNVVLEYGVGRSDVIGNNVFNFVSKEHWQEIRNGFRKVAQGNPNEGELRINRRHRKGYAVIEYRSNPIIQENKVVGAQTIVRDITERKMLEKKLRHYSEHLEELVQERTQELLESEKRYSVLVEEASDAVVIAQDGKIAFINKKGAEMIDYPRDELIGVPFEILVDEKHRQFIQEVAIGRLRGEMVPETVEFEAITKGGKRVLVEAHGTFTHYQGRPALLSIMRDISDRRRMEEERSRLDRLAAVGELATMVAHDLRNPLTSIRNASFYIRDTCSCNVDANKTKLEMLDIIEQETTFANNIINDLLEFGAYGSLQKKRQNINKIIEHCLQKNRISKTIEVESNFVKKAAANVDETQLERVFLNLIKNATQAMPKGGKITITTKQTGDYLEITFTDTGMGIPKENLDKIFGPFFTTRAKGIGIGLAICKKIVEQHDGKIDVESKVGKGTTFTIKLPKKEGVINQ